MTALAGKKADIYLTSGAAVSMPLEAMSDVSTAFGGLARTVYAVTNNVKRYFDPTSTLTFDISLNSGGSWNPVTPDFVRASSIAFIAQQQAAPAAMFRVNTGKYLPYARMGGGHEWEMTPTNPLIDVTEFGMTSKKHLATSVDEGTVTLRRWYADDTMRALISGSILALILYTDATAQPGAPRYDLLARLKQDSIKAAVTNAIEEDLTFEIQSDVTYASS